MARRLKNASFERQSRWYDTHRSSIESGLYTPYWRCQDLRSSGIKVKVAHFKDPYRVVHLLSMNELLEYMRIARDPETQEVYEQYALPLEETVTISRELNVEHPKHIGSRVPAVQTLDFFWKGHNGKLKGVAVKQASWADDYRTQEKLAIQEGWCQINGIEFEVVNSDELKTIYCENLEFLYPHRHLMLLFKNVFPTWLSNFIGEVSAAIDDRLAHVIRRAAETTGIRYEVATNFFYHALWTDQINIDLNQRIGLEKAASELRVYPNDKNHKKLR